MRIDLQILSLKHDPGGVHPSQIFFKLSRALILFKDNLAKLAVRGVGGESRPVDEDDFFWVGKGVVKGRVKKGAFNF